ncbi:unnamed protein product, partial [Mesorhabditis spiculigera]
MGNLALIVDLNEEIPLTLNREVFVWMEYASVVGIVFNLFGLWVIGFHTPQSMRDFGIALTAYQVLVLLTDALLSSILSPYFIFPIPGGYPTGWLWELGVSTQLQTSLGIVIGFHTEVLLMIMFMLRHQAIMPATHFLKFKPRPMFCFYIILQLCVYLNVIVVSIYIFYGDDQEATKAMYLDSYPILRQFLEIPRCYTFTPDNGLIVVYGVAGWTVLTFIVILAASVSSFHVLHVKQHTMSVQTHRLQKQWMKNCLLQVSVPFAFVVAPVIALILIVVFESTVYFGDPVIATYAKLDLVPGGYPTGWLWELGVSTQLQTSIGLAVALHTEALLMVMFMLRHQAIMPATHLLKFRPRPMFCFYVALQLFVYILVLVMSCIIFHGDDQVATKAVYLEKYPMLRQFLEIPRCMALSKAGGLIVAYGGGAWTIFTFLVMLVVAMFFNAFGVWVIGFHTPNTMRAYGIALTAYQILSFLTDAFLSWILSPYFIFPIPGGYPNGWLWTFGVSTQVQIVIGLSVAAHMISLLMIMFMLRHQAIMPPTHLLKFDPSYMIGFYIGLQFFAYTHVISVSSYVFYDDDVAATKAYYLERYFMFREFLEVPRTYVFTPANGFLVVSNVFAWAIALLVLVLGASFSSFHVLHVRRHMMSEKTYNLQKKWMKNCLLQVSIPLITIVLPVVIAVIDIALDLVVIFVWVQPRTFVLSETSTIAVTKQTRMATKMRVAAANASFMSNSPLESTMNDVG